MQNAGYRRGGRVRLFQDFRQMDKKRFRCRGRYNHTLRCDGFRGRLNLTSVTGIASGSLRIGGRQLVTGAGMRSCGSCWKEAMLCVNTGICAVVAAGTVALLVRIGIRRDRQVAGTGAAAALPGTGRHRTEPTGTSAGGKG